MSLATVHWSSAVIGKKTSMQVLLPDVGEPPYPTFYLLHGMTDDSTMWLRRTRIEWYVRNLPLIVVMPDGYRGFYTNNAEGPAYARHFGDELTGFVEKFFPAKAERGGRAIGGLSMGGYGALRLALGYAEKFCSVNSHSGAVSWSQLNGDADYEAEARVRNWAPEFARELRRIFGPKASGSEHDLVVLAKRAKAAERLPAMRLDCGTEDFLIEANRRFTRELTEAGIAHEYEEYPGVHDWDYWDLHVQEALRFHARNLGLA